MVVKTTGVVKYDLTREYLVGTNSGTENNVSQKGNTVHFQPDQHRRCGRGAPFESMSP